MRLLNEEFIQYIFKTVLGLRDHLRLANHAVNAEVRAPHRTPNGPRARLPQIVLAVVQNEVMQIF